MMASLSPSLLLRVWEEGLGHHPADRPILILRAGEPGAEDLASLPIFECDRRLLRLRQATFGDRLSCLVNCPACGLKQEFELSVTQLLTAYEEPEPGADQSIEMQGYRILLRPLQGRDLSEAARCSDLEAAEHLLVSRAIASATSPEGEVSPDELPAALRQEVKEKLSERESATDVSLDVACYECGERWAPVLDIGAYLWAELETEARRLLLHVAALARRYGWAEGDILAMSPARRRAYLNLEGLA